jgi:hypothetical protein
MAQIDYLLGIKGIEGESTDKAIPRAPQPMSPSIRLKLQRLGMTDSGIAQLAAGVPISDANDRHLVERVVAVALGPY